MLYLAGAIVFSSWLTIAFKIADRLRISTFQAIIFNYFTCVTTGIILEGEWPAITSVVRSEWFVWAILMGLMFICVFNLVAYTTKKSGVAIASVANKLSLVIPFLFSIFLYNETMTSSKLAGIILALISVTLTCWTSDTSTSVHTKRSLQLMFIPLILFVGSGMLDTLIKYVEHYFINEHNNNLYIITAFSVAGIAGSLVLISRLMMGTERFDLRAVLAGIIIGVPNYFSLWCLMYVLKKHTGNSSAIMPITNMGIVLFSTLSAVIFFRERLKMINWTGIILALLAIYLIAFG